jgi:hypothetical protein
MTLAIPELAWTRLRAFLGAGATGQVVFHVHQGRVAAVELRETLRCSDRNTLDEGVTVSVAFGPSTPTIA